MKKRQVTTEDHLQDAGYVRRVSAGRMPSQWHEDGLASGIHSRQRTVEEHIRGTLAHIPIPDPIEVALLDAQGLLCGEQVVAQAPLPSFDHAATDGYAVRAADVARASADHPTLLPVVGDIVAGSRSVRTVGHGLCVRVTAGAPMPAGADTVVPVDATDGGVARVLINRGATKGAYVRRIGEDVATGEVAVQSGTPIGPAQVGILAGVGCERVLVRPRPRVAVISTGNELVDVGGIPGSAETIDVNSYALAAAARDSGAEIFRVGIVPGDKRALVAMLEGQLSRADLIITSGGVSTVRFDVLKEALSELGTVEFVKVAMQPGGPQGFGTLGHEQTPIFCLPGNPVAALVAFEVFVRPALRRMLGKRRLFRRTVTAMASRPLKNSADVRQYRHGLLHREGHNSYTVEPLGDPSAYTLANLAQSNCLIILNEGVGQIAAGEQVTVLPTLLPHA